MIPLITWLEDYAALGGWLVAGSLVASIGGLLLVRLLVLYLPADYLVADRPAAGHWRSRHPVIRWTLLVVKNLAGVLLLAVGVTMLVTPGPGVLTLVMALVLLDFPGKLALERRILALPPVLHQLNKMRVRANRLPLQSSSQVEDVK